MSAVFGAIDIGASGGRVMAGVVHTGGSVELHAVHRFRNGASRRDGHLRWDLTALLGEVRTGLAALAAAHPGVTSIGIDTWSVDYALLDASGNLLAEPISYRDDRTATVIPSVDAVVSRQRQYAVNGLQHLPFTTLYQLAAERESPNSLWHRAAHVVLLPDVIAHELTGVLRTEVTNASTTGLLDACTGSWSAELFEALGLPADRFPELEAPGAVRGEIRSEVLADTGLRAGTVVTTVGSHDTASAVVGVPAVGRDIAYVSSGTWSLVGVELEAPVLTEASRAANFTNEHGVDARIRYLRNVGGLWLLQECLREWGSPPGASPELAALLAEASRLPPGPLIDVDDESFIAPGDMPNRIARAAGGTLARAGIVRCIVDSLADAYARTVTAAARLSGRRVGAVHVVGGGSQNELLCRAAARSTGLPVIAGPVEATALGNVLIQARTHGAAPASLEELRAGLAATQSLRRYEPD